VSYATQADLEAAFGADELRMLADRDRDGSADAAVVARALDAAEAEINSWLGGRYNQPLDPVPAQIRDIACDIARYRLDSVNPREVTRARYRDAIAALKDLSTGAAVLGSAGAGAGQVVAPPAGILAEGGSSVFGDDALRGF
jgi:phage gp36-like protein